MKPDSTLGSSQASYKRRGSRKLTTNPFKYSQNFTKWQKFKLFLGAIILLPIRCVFIFIFLVLSLIVANLGTIGHNKGVFEKPFSGLKKYFWFPLFKILARTVFFFASVPYINVKGKRASKEEAPIFVLAPHTSFADTLPVLMVENFCIVANSGTAAGFFGCFVRMAQPVVVDRDSPDSRKKVIDEIQKRCHDPIGWPQIAIFPEGTCSNGSALFTYKIGAFYPGVPVQPVVIRWPNKVDTVTWTWDGPDWPFLVFLTLSTFRTYLEIEFLPVHVPTQEEIKDPQLYANNVRDEMAVALGVPTVEYSFDACRKVTLAMKHGVPMDMNINELFDLAKIYFYNNRSKSDGNNVADIQKAFETFSKEIKHNQLVRSLSKINLFKPFYSSNPILIETLDDYYVDQTNMIDAKRLAVHMMILFHPGDFEERINACFQCYDRVETSKTEPELMINNIDAIHLIKSLCPPNLYDDIKATQLLKNVHMYQEKRYNNLTQGILPKHFYAQLVGCYSDILYTYWCHFQASPSADQQMYFTKHLHAIKDETTISDVMLNSLPNISGVLQQNKNQKKTQ